MADTRPPAAATRPWIHVTRVGAACGFLLALTACAGETARSEACLPGDYEVGALADGGQGLLRCGPEGGAYLPYDGPDPNALPDANVPDTGPCGANGAPLAYFCFGCSPTSPCAPGLVCQDFPNKGGYVCTLPCTPATASICVAPSAGCGNTGMCKP